MAREAGLGYYLEVVDPSLARDEGVLPEPRPQGAVGAAGWNGVVVLNGRRRADVRRRIGLLDTRLQRRQIVDRTWTAGGEARVVDRRTVPVDLQSGLGLRE